MTYIKRPTSMTPRVPKDRVDSSRFVVEIQTPKTHKSTLINRLTSAFSSFSLRDGKLPEQLIINRTINSNYYLVLEDGLDQREDPDTSDQDEVERILRPPPCPLTRDQRVHETRSLLLFIIGLASASVVIVLMPGIMAPMICSDRASTIPGLRITRYFMCVQPRVLLDSSTAILEHQHQLDALERCVTSLVRDQLPEVILDHIHQALLHAVGSGPSLGRYSLVLRTSCDHVRTLPALSGTVPIVPLTFRTSLSLALHPEPTGPIFPRSGPSYNSQEHVRNLSHRIHSLSSQRSASHVIVPSLLVRISLSLVIT
ncbi:hypothetical protein M405DRAFT_870517 [Rhizopogon salebrosus TDB-379]|nr:hypothetical protein M405DRAFT_870517 [Rhizopogon salebrosus TDB-379]